MFKVSSLSLLASPFLALSSVCDSGSLQTWSTLNSTVARLRFEALCVHGIRKVALE